MAGSEQAVNKKIRSKVVKDKAILTNNIVNMIGVDFMYNLSLLHFILVYTYQNTNSASDKYYNMLNVCIKIGKKMFNRYMNHLKNAHIKHTGKEITYRSWLTMWNENNIDLSILVEDDYYAELGGKIIEILEHCEMIKKKLVANTDSTSSYEKHYVLFVPEDSVARPKNSSDIFTLPSKLPMICEPKDYSKQSLGGYLLNDETIRITISKDKHKLTISDSYCILIDSLT